MNKRPTKSRILPKAPFHGRYHWRSQEITTNHVIVRGENFVWPGVQTRLCSGLRSRLTMQTVSVQREPCTPVPSTFGQDRLTMSPSQGSKSVFRWIQQAAKSTAQPLADWVGGNGPGSVWQTVTQLALAATATSLTDWQCNCPQAPSPGLIWHVVIISSYY